MNEENKKETVCAVVVTYNRKNLLLECLEAIRRQTRPVDRIYIIDNASDDGTPELLKEKGYNIPELPPFNINGIPFNIYEDKNVLLVEEASFVSLLISRDIVKSFGLPIKEFFIWADDVEYTLRIAKNGFVGLYVKDSIVIHKTKTNYSANEIYDWRFYYNVRNWLWIHKIHNRRKYISSLLKNIFRTFSLPLKVWRLNIKACADSFFTNPKIDFVDK